MTNTPFLIRLALPADLPQVAAIDYEAFSPYGTAESPDIFSARLSTFPDGFIVLESQGIVLGYGSSEKWLEEREPGLNEDPFDTHHPNGRIFCITAMAVRRAWQRQGLGTALLGQLFTIARRQACGQIVLETTHAQGFYAPHGFQVVRQRQEAGVTLSILRLALEQNGLSE